MFRLNITALAAILAVVSGSAAETWSNGESTKTLEPQALGTATEGGALLVSMNYCSVVMNTQCQVTVATQGPGSPYVPPPPPAVQTASSVDAVGNTPDHSGQSVPAPTGISAPTDSAPKTEATGADEGKTHTHTHGGSQITKTVASHGDSSPTEAPPASSSALTAAAVGKLFPGAAWGAALVAAAAML